MADEILGTVDPADFAATSSRWEGVAKRRVRVRDEDGDHDAYELADGLIVGKALRVASTAKATADAAAKSATDAVNTKVAAARTVVRNQVARVRAIPQASRTDTDRWLLALSFLLYAEE